MVAGAAIAAGLLLLRPASGGPAEPPPVKYKEITVSRGAFRVSVTANGLVRPIDRIELKSKASGAVKELPIEAGQQVEEGALIARLDQVEERSDLAQARADLAIAEAELSLARKNFARRRELFERNVVSKEVRDQTELELAVARSKRVQATTAVERAEERMADTVVTAPVAGTILQKYVEEGQIIASGVSNVGGGTPIADIADMRVVHIEAGIDEIDIGRIEVGQVASIRAEAYPDRPYQGVVTRIAPEARVEQNVTLFDVVIRVENTDGNLKSGMNAGVGIVVVDEDDVLTVPLTALEGPVARDGRASVRVQEGEGLVSREIRTGRTDHRVVEVLEGLEGGERLGIPMVSRLKADHDFLDARIRNSRSFGAGSREPAQRPSGTSKAP